jgi:hypothetical protein
MLHVFDGSWAFLDEAVGYRRLTEREARYHRDAVGENDPLLP